MKDNYQTIGARLKTVRKEMTQKEFARELDISAPALQKYELNESVPGGLALAKLVEKGINVNWILKGEGLMYIQLPDDRILQELVCKVFMACRDKEDVSDMQRAKLLTRAYGIALNDGLEAALEYVYKMAEELDYYL
ncbi:MAG TPA: helix-turn-helix transcriptional regulator [Geobacteraceae bacterium]|nr:helix-turn-helix transcriptional regulator [Geobacteraceae bacterium]